MTSRNYRAIYRQREQKARAAGTTVYAQRQTRRPTLRQQLADAHAEIERLRAALPTCQLCADIIVEEPHYDDYNNTYHPHCCSCRESDA